MNMSLCSTRSLPTVPWGSLSRHFITPQPTDSWLLWLRPSSCAKQRTAIWFDIILKLLLLLFTLNFILISFIPIRSHKTCPPYFSSFSQEVWVTDLLVSCPCLEHIAELQTHQHLAPLCQATVLRPRAMGLLWVLLVLELLAEMLMSTWCSHLEQRISRGHIKVNQTTSVELIEDVCQRNCFLKSIAFIHQLHLLSWHKKTVNVSCFQVLVAQQTQGPAPCRTLHRDWVFLWWKVLRDQGQVGRMVLWMCVYTVYVFSVWKPFQLKITNGGGLTRHVMWNVSPNVLDLFYGSI